MRKRDVDISHVPFWLPKDKKMQFRIICTRKEKTMQKILTEFVDRFIAENGEGML